MLLSAFSRRGFEFFFEVERVLENLVDGYLSEGGFIITENLLVEFLLVVVVVTLVYSFLLVQRCSFVFHCLRLSLRRTHVEVIVRVTRLTELLQVL